MKHLILLFVSLSTINAAAATKSSAQIDIHPESKTEVCPQAYNMPMNMPLMGQDTVARPVATAVNNENTVK